MRLNLRFRHLIVYESLLDFWRVVAVRRILIELQRRMHSGRTQLDRINREPPSSVCRREEIPLFAIMSFIVREWILLILWRLAQNLHN